MGAQGMAQSVKFNLQQKGKRQTIYDRKDTRRKGVYQDLNDHKALNSHSFALFQKEQFARRKKERKQKFWLRLAVLLITIGIVMLFLYLWNVTDGTLFISSEFK
ncbi:MAG: hypothetical protein AAF489_15305 [Bacteroidota bacterium]